VSIIGAVVVAFFATVGIATFYETPTCSDGKQNQDETGVDCGGSCRYLCTAEQIAPTVLFARPLQTGNGRTDVIAEVENKNATAAAKDVPYTITFYDSTQTFVQNIQGTLDLPPSATVPIFMSGISSGKQVVTAAFLTVDSSAVKWYRLITDPRVVPDVASPTLGGTTAAPRIEAAFTNPTTMVLSDIKAIVVVRNDRGDVIAASQTIVPTIPAQGVAKAIFTWNEPFMDVPARIEVTPITPLP